MISSRIALVVGASLALFFCRGTVRAQQGAGKQPVPWGPRQQKEARDRLAQQRVRIAAATVPPQAQPAGAGETLQSINDEYNRQLLQLEQQRLDRLTRLAASQSPKEAAETYEVLFRLAIANNLFTQAEPAADRVRTAANSPSPVVRFLAETINLIATADRGAYDESLVDLRRLVGAGAPGDQGAAPAALLDTPSLLAICGAYYQRLDPGRAIRRGAQGVSTARPGEPQSRCEGVYRPPTPPARPDRQGGSSHPGRRRQRQAVRPGRAQGRCRPRGLLGELVPAQRRRGRLARPGLRDPS